MADKIPLYLLQELGLTMEQVKGIDKQCEDGPAAILAILFTARQLGLITMNTKKR